MRRAATRSTLRRLRRKLAGLVIFYFVAGSASQKLIPGVDEIFPLFGWSLFSKIPNHASRYTILIHAHEGRPVEPALTFHQAPASLVRGTRSIGRKLIQTLGRAHDEGRHQQVESLRRQLEANYLASGLRYELIFESYDPLQKWRTGENTELRSLASLESSGAR